MGLLDKFKSKKPETAPEPVQEQKSEAVKPEPKIVPMASGKQVLVRPLLSEKGTHFAANGKYVFVVDRSANKPEIKKTVQKLYNVHVEDVKIINMPSKKRRYGMTAGETSPMKKAVVILRSGEKIPGIVEAVG